MFPDGTHIVTSTLKGVLVDDVTKTGVAITRNTVYNLGLCADDTYLDLFKGEQQ